MARRRASSAAVDPLLSLRRYTGAMIGPRLTSVFKSRKAVLLWAAMVLWSAVEFANYMPSHKGGAATDGEDAQPISNEDAAALKGVLSGQ